MLWYLVAVLLALLVAYVVHTLLSSAGSDYADNSFDAFVDDNPSSQSLSKDAAATSGKKADYYSLESSCDMPVIMRILAQCGSEHRCQIYCTCMI